MKARIHRRAGAVAAAGALALLAAVDGAYVLGSRAGTEEVKAVRATEAAARSSAVAAASTSVIRAMDGALELDQLPAGVDRDAAKRAQDNYQAFVFAGARGCVVLRLGGGAQYQVPKTVTADGQFVRIGPTRDCTAGGEDPDGSVGGKVLPREYPVPPPPPLPPLAERWKKAMDQYGAFAYRVDDTFVMDLDRCSRYIVPVAPPAAGMVPVQTMPGIAPADTAPGGYCSQFVR